MECGSYAQLKFLAEPGVEIREVLNGLLLEFA